MFHLIISFLVSISSLALEAPKDFHQDSVALDGVRLNVYRGGTGSPVLLLPGYGESALWWTPAMKELSKNHDVIVPDLRGGGASQVTEGGYDKATMARDMRNLLDHYGLKHAVIVGHDIGLMVAYAFAAQYPAMTDQLVLMDAFLPGIANADDIYNSPSIYHFRVHGSFAEKLVAGREKIYLDALWTGFSVKPSTFTEADKTYYTKQYAQPGHMRAGFAWFSEFPNDAIWFRKMAEKKLTMPVLGIGGEKANATGVDLAIHAVASDAHMVTLANTGHWLMNENPEGTVSALKNFIDHSTKLGDARMSH